MYNYLRIVIIQTLSAASDSLTLGETSIALKTGIRKYRLTAPEFHLPITLI